MKALRFEVSIPGYLMGRALGNVTDSVVFGSLSGFSLVDVPDPPLPGPDWVRLEVMMAGICGSDIAAFTFKASPALEPFVSFPAVPGHEVLARVVEVGPSVTRVKVGERTSVDPSISCAVRGRAPGDRCASCTDGLAATCLRAGDAGGPSPSGAPLARGFLVGSNADLQGGFGERMIAHESQLFPIRTAIEDSAAVLTEPLSIGVHAVLQLRPDPAASALVIGSGPIALATIWALRALGHTGPIVAQTKRAGEAKLALELGASSAVSPGPQAREALFGTGARAYKPLVGPEVFGGGGFELIVDCVGSRESLDQSLRFAAPRGTIALLGCAGQIGSLDLTFLWAREVRVAGFLCYGTESFRDEKLHTFEVTHRLLAETRAPIASLVTHRYPLAQYQQALRAAARRSESGAMKVLLTPKA
jgi:threonine dehydrogenase-like Zn-dependent dehydrogenase